MMTITKKVGQHNVLMWGLFIAFVVLLINRAWLSDDIFITLRTVDNFVSGYGLTWNIIERVQAYTHPLWMFLISVLYFVTREEFYTLIFLSLTISAIAVAFWMLKVSRSKEATALGLVALMLSVAFIDYSTSGLENPLTHLLLVIFVFYFLQDEPYTPRRIFILSFIASLALLNRVDTGLFYFPALIYAWYQSTDRKKSLVSGMAGQFPMICWALFSMLYYGFPVPNTYYAKLNTGIPSGEIYHQGFLYYLYSFETDLVTMTVIAFAIFIVLYTRHKRNIVLSVGLVLYLLYIVRIGGDFMGGRFFTAPLFLAILMLSQYKIAKIDILAMGTILAVLTIFLASSTLDAGVTGVWDERAGYDTVTGLAGASRYTQEYGQWAAQAEQHYHSDLDYAPAWQVGQLGYYGPRDLYLIDTYALGDPLLSRLPALYDPTWNPGHYLRFIPEEHTGSSDDVLLDSNLDTFNNHLQVITRGDIWSWARLKTIVDMNLGRYDDLIDENRYRYAKRATGDLLQFVTSHEGGEFNVSGLVLTVSPEQIDTIRALGEDVALVFEVDPHSYNVLYRLDEQIVASHYIGRGTEGILYRIPIPNADFNNIWIKGLSHNFILHYVDIVNQLPVGTDYPVTSRTDSNLALLDWRFYGLLDGNKVDYDQGEQIHFVDTWATTDEVNFTGQRQIVVTNGNSVIVQVYTGLHFPLFKVDKPYQYNTSAVIPMDTEPGTYDVLIQMTRSDNDENVVFLNEAGDSIGEYYYLTTIHVHEASSE
ncbi:hypothetical protein ACFLYO_02015 [Chloroflexota bacterium]